MKIRKATGVDADALAALRHEFRAGLEAATEAKPAFVARAAPWMRDRLESWNWHCWIAEDETGVLGHVWLQLIEKIPNPVAEPESMAYITNVYVRPTARGAGIGSRLLAEALDWCRAIGADGALLRPTERSRPLYERHGFQPGTGLMEVRFDGEAPSDRDGLTVGA